MRKRCCTAQFYCFHGTDVGVEIEGLANGFFVTAVKSLLDVDVVRDIDKTASFFRSKVSYFLYSNCLKFIMQ